MLDLGAEKTGQNVCLSRLEQPLDIAERTEQQELIISLSLSLSQVDISF